MGCDNISAGVASMAVRSPFVSLQAPAVSRFLSLRSAGAFHSDRSVIVLRPERPTLPIIEASSIDFRRLQSTMRGNDAEVLCCGVTARTRAASERGKRCVTPVDADPANPNRLSSRRPQTRARPRQRRSSTLPQLRWGPVPYPSRRLPAVVLLRALGADGLRSHLLR